MDIYQKYHEEILNHMMDLKDQKRDWNPARITQNVLQKHSDVLCTSEDTRYLCTMQLRTMVGKLIAKHTMLKNDENQLTIPFIEGFDLIQSHYIIEDKEGEKIGKHIINMTVDEINLIADRMDKTAKTLIRHAKQLRDFAIVKESSNVLI